MKKHSPPLGPDRQTYHLKSILQGGNPGFAEPACPIKGTAEGVPQWSTAFLLHTHCSYTYAGSLL